MKPNLFIIGAMKSGTSSLYDYLVLHPEIYMSPIKEPNYFVSDETVKQQRERYEALFEHAGAATYIGEASTAYTKAPRVVDVARRIADYNPHSRFIYIMRDPIERTISHYWWNWQKDENERDIITALQEKSDYLAFSYYAMQLRSYVNEFGLSRIFTLTLEELNREPSKTLQQVTTWLNISSDFLPEDTKKHSNATPNKVQNLRRKRVLYNILRSKVWRSVARPLLPSTVRMFWKNIFADTADRSEFPRQEVIEYLRPIQTAQTEELSSLLNRQFTEWTTLYEKDFK